MNTVAGRFVEVGGGAATAGLSWCARLVWEAQRAGGLAAWVGDAQSVFYPPDLSACGVDLGALAVVRLSEARQVWRACDTLLGSGGFALVVVDVQGELLLPLSAQTRLSGLAQHHNSALVALTRMGRTEAARSSLVSLRAVTEKHRTGHDCFSCELHALKDKRRVPGWRHEELRRGTDGLC